MFWVLIGIILGGLWVLLSRAVPLLALPVDALTAAISHTGSAATEGAVRALGMGADSPLAHTAGVLAGVILPGAVCFVSAEAAVTSRAARNAAAVVLTGGAAAAFLWLPGPQALALLAAALILDVLLAIGHPVLLRLPIAAVVAAITGRLLIDITTGGPLLRPGVAALTRYGGDPSLWKLALTVAALAPAVAAVNLLLRRG